MAIQALIGLAGTIIDKLFPDPKEAAAAKVKLMAEENEAWIKEFEARVNVIVAETASGDPWVRRWRPALMYIFMAIVANNYILAPYVQLFGGPALELELPPDMWDIIKIGLGGYVVGRSVEKSIQNWKAGDA